jgi:hypothetical protein
MFFNINHRIVLFAVFLFVAVIGLLVMVTPAAIFPDASWGFQILRSMQLGAPFNTLMRPSHDNIASNAGEFISWWSPGQYLIPYFFKSVFGLNTGHAASLTTAFCQLTGLVGFYLFFKRAGFTPLISALSLVVIICQQAFFIPYIFYIGGETLLFAFAGWFLYGCLLVDKPNWKVVIFVLLSGWIGFICKSSFIWIYAAGLLFIWIRLCSDIKGVKSWLFRGFWVGVPAVIAVVIIYVLYLSKGLNPSSGSNGIDLRLRTLAFPIASPILAGFSADDLVNGFYFHNDAAILSPLLADIIVYMLAALSILLVSAICLHVPNKSYRLSLIIFYAVSIVFFASAFIRKLDISYESRHFRIIGALITPGILSLFARYKLIYRICLCLVIVIIGYFPLHFYTTGYKGLKVAAAYGTSGIGQQFIDQQSLDYIKSLDDKNRNAIFVFFSADLGLEIQHNRIITLPELNKDLNIDFEEYLHKGHAGPLYILMPSDYVGIKANVILKAFPGYKGFSLKELSDNYVLYFTTEAR